MPDGIDTEGNFIVFQDTLYPDKPCIFSRPRDHDSLYYVTEGGLLYTRDGISVTVPTGSVGYVPIGGCDRSQAVGQTPVSYIAVNFNFCRIGKPEDCPALPLSYLCEQNMSGVYEPMFSGCLRAFLREGNGQHYRSLGLFLQIYATLLEENPQGKRSASIEPGLRLLRESCGQSVTVKEAAWQCHLSVNHFTRLCREETGVSPGAYLRNARISLGESLLRGTEKPVGEIALQCGFSDIFGFSHAFKTINGISPSAWRNRERKTAL